MQRVVSLNRTCFVTESMSRMYRSCSWRTPATAHAQSAVNQPITARPPARPPSGIKWTVGVPYSDGTRPKRFIKDYRIICPIARQNYIGLRSHQKVQGPNTLSHVWDFKSHKKILRRVIDSIYTRLLFFVLQLWKICDPKPECDPKPKKNPGFTRVVYLRTVFRRWRAFFVHVRC